MDLGETICSLNFIFSYILSILSVLYYDAKLRDIGRWCSRIALELWMQEKNGDPRIPTISKYMQFGFNF
jgi:hypothetical protein